MTLNYDYTASKAYCEHIGLFWLGEDFIRNADTDAKLLGFTQDQVTCAMQHHLWQVKWLFTPSSYSYKHRFLLAFHFLFGRKK